MNDRVNESVTFSDLALALANDYSSLFVIYKDDSYVEYAPDGADKKLVQVSSGVDFYKDVRHECHEKVWKEDQEYFLGAFRRENVEKALKDGRSFSLTYRLDIDGHPRYYYLKTIRGSDRSIIIGVQDIDKQKREELEAAEEKMVYSEIADSLASLFEVIYHVDIKTGHYSEYSSSKSYASLGLNTCGIDFFKSTERDIQQLIHPDDRKYFMHEMQRDVLLANLKRSKSVSLTYRQMLNGVPVYMNLIAFIQKNDSQSIVIGVRNINEQKKRDAERETYLHIAEALAGKYEMLYYIDSETGGYKRYSASEQYARLGTTVQGADFFTDVVSDVRKYVHPNDVDHILYELQKERLTANLNITHTISYSYLQLLDGRYQYMSLTAVRPDSDSRHIIIGAVNMDSQVRRELTIKEKSKTFSDISLALAQRYEVIYHVNTVTNEYVEYSASEKYSKLKVGTKGKDFFAETQINMKKDIYPEDLPRMSAAMMKDNLLKNLSENGKTVISYRLMLDGKPQYVALYAVRPKEDSKHIIIAVANVDSAKRLEMDYQTAVDLANKDPLTSVKNKRAYVQAEMELDQLISESESAAFAIVVCDINGLKQVNDCQGHKAGDDFIRFACSIICDTFNHSPVFRIGGDEFAVILKGKDYEKRRSLMAHLDGVLHNNLHNGMVVLAAGLSDFRSGVDMRVQDVFERADSRMYQNKKLCKSERIRVSSDN